MSTILDQLAAYARERVEAARRIHPPEELRREAEQLKHMSFAFEKALRKTSEKNGAAEKEIAFICECKKASPSKGLISPDFPYLSVAKEYEAAGADCISVLTEPKWFLGKDAYLREIAQAVQIPCLRKDFTIDEYMIWEARLLGASAVLLICSLLSDEQLSEYLGICDALGMSALTEAHDEKEIERALNAGARVIGVNNRNLRDFTVDPGNSARLRELVPGDVVFVAESGIRDASDVAALKAAGADAVLIGETLMRASDKKAMLAELKGEKAVSAAGCRKGNEEDAQGEEKETAPPFPVKVKFCGLRREEDIAAADLLKPDYAGYIFVKQSPRCVEASAAAALTKMLDPGIVPVGVFMDEDPARICRLAAEGTIRAVQLHGAETDPYIRELKGRLKRLVPEREIPVIKAFGIRTPEDAKAANASAADYILLDAVTGGSGRMFDHTLLESIHRPYFLAGGLDPDNIAEIVRTLRSPRNGTRESFLYAVDVSTGIEVSGEKGRKDPEKMRRFMEKLHEQGE